MTNYTANEAGSITKILVPLDGSERAEAVLPYVRELATRSGAQIILTRCIPALATPNPAVVMDYVEAESPKAQSYLGRRRRRLKAGGFNVTTRILHGSVAESVTDLAEREKADLIAITTRGRSGIARALLGSVATRILRLATRPVLAVKPAEDAPDPSVFDRILIALDGSDLAEAVLPAARDLASAAGGSLILYRVAEKDNESSEARLYLEHLAEEMGKHGPIPRVKVETGPPVKAIMHIADEIDAGVIALASRGRGALGRAFKGSVADQILRNSGRACLIVRPEPHEDEPEEDAAE